ncbi:single-stranded-DNA-specific exonuclease RecJ [Idiomarina loihiensis]|jgi:single-stranded-DNA-specific exonuclease|uniref:single-stranded-DNA-specific exonuclease RecJ n=1 Tax=Idiomarina TaxID=135575 RepID=UPI000C0EE34D|nr:MULTISPECIES: single-stranded-DNA-specific exonuclease RecJ [Idiomarina]MRJ43715.1 single-stranded-DNA-specific exonuclease RecJ [Idiomarina loihiensis]PHQ92219.1 MAG: single-stranded-DNA-specific exonuclease RecJ [Idiomarina sp.]UTW34149.1 single-stranded-DNA-specific exonuclease RecJ [Idiomarina loihiensis]|tara:strand:- start:11210 stop:12922 length:1713 start_codon:yes stop_codon:yes gene_type:complete
MSDYEIRRYQLVDDDFLPQQMPPLLRQIYARRGVRRADELSLKASGLLHFSSLRDIGKAVELLQNALKNQEKVCICGDFDADGATSSALMVSALQAFGLQQVGYRVPNRMTDGYGLSVAMVEQLAVENVQLIVTVDNGIAAHDAIVLAREKGIQVLVTDHHLPPEELPPANAIVNPNQHGCEFSSKNLAGVGVAFYVLLALRSALREQGVEPLPNLADWLDLVALGTVADVVPLDYNNRVLVQQGIARIRKGMSRPGIKALLEVANRDASQLAASDLGFALGPRINAAGRLDDIGLGIECLLAGETRAQQLAQQLNDLNQQRKSIETEMREHAESAVAKLCFDQGQVPDLVTLYQPDWHAGVIGIVAGRVKEQVNRPVIALANDDDEFLKGSARSVSGLHMRDLLERVHSLQPGIMERFGGHAMAAGLTMKKENLTRFSELAEQVASEWLSEEQKQRVFWSDGELTTTQLSLDSVNTLQSAGPWGQQFPEPMFDGQFELVDQRIVGERHLKLVVRHPQGELLDAIAFNVDTQQWPARQASVVELLYKPQLNHFRGRTNVQLLVEQIRAIR